MSYVANQYNYATPLSGVFALVGEQSAVADKKYFTLSDNVLDGSYSPIEGDVGIWGTELSGANGGLSDPFVITITESTTFNAFRLISSVYNYPVAFTVRFYNGSTLLYAITEDDNSSNQYIHYLPRTVQVTHYEISITRISAFNATARLYNVHNPGYVKRVDNARLKSADISILSSLHQIDRVDTLSMLTSERHSMYVPIATSDDIILATPTTNRNISNAALAVDTLRVATTDHISDIQSTISASDTISVAHSIRPQNLTKVFGTSDSVRAALREAPTKLTNSLHSIADSLLFGCVDHSGFSLPANVHTKMKEASRRIYGKVYITYTDPMLEADTRISGSDTAYNSVPAQLLDGDVETNKNFFNLYENDLTGNYVVSDENSQVGWVSSTLSNSSGGFDGQAPVVRIEFAARPVANLSITFDDSRDAIPVDFTVTYIIKNGTSVPFEFVNNTNNVVTITQRIADVVAVSIEVTKLSRAGYPVVILDVPVMSTLEYVGYQDRSDLISIDLLEELTYEDDVEALGGVSANIVTIALDNSNKDFYFNNTDSIVASSLTRNRKIVPWLGTEVTEGEIEWYTLGTFWSYRWDVPVESLVAKVVGFDTIGLLDKTSFNNHVMQKNMSIGQLIAYVLDDAKQQLSFITYKIDDALYNITIPYAWFDDASHTAALRKISKCYPMHIYCDRDGTICAAPQKLHLDYYYDTWSDSTNVISKRYDSLHTTLPNILNVEVKAPVEKANEVLVEDILVFNVQTIGNRTLVFKSPYISDAVVNIDCDSTVQYTYDIYSWGIVVNFTGTGNVRSIKCIGTALDISNSAIISSRNEESIHANGAIKRDISSDFIQTADLATILIERITSLSERDKFDVYVEYRGDISLTINDPILLLDGVAPDNRYNIKRHSLFWDGALTGSAHLNT